MRAGGIFGGGALGSLGSLGYTPTGGGAALTAACAVVKQKGMLDRAARVAYVRYVPGTSDFSFVPTESEALKLSECYKAGYDNAANTACLTARTLGENDKRAGRPNDTTGLVKKTAGNVEDVVLLVDCYNTGYNYTTAAGPPAPGGGSDPGDGGGYGTRDTPAPSGVTGACTSRDVIMAVQTKIGTTADGAWGPKSQTALKASGKTFKDWAPGCTGNVPYYGGSGLTTTVATTTPGGVVAPPKPPLLGSMGEMTKSPIFWAVGLALAVGGYFYLSGPKKGSRK
jgi:hypothetical protein